MTADTIDLKGGAIASSNAAKSALTTNALTVENISNSMNYSAQSVSMSGGFSGGNSSSGSNGANSTGNNGSPSTAAATDTAPTQTSSGASNPNLTPGMALQTKGSASSTTYGTLTDGNIKIGGQSMTSAASLGAHTDLATANAGIAALPNLKNVMTNQQAMAAAATTVIATGVQIGNDRAAAANQQAEQAGAAIKNANNTIAQAQAVLNDSNSTQAQQEQAQQELAQATQNLTTAQQAEQTAKATAASWGPTGDNTRALKVVTGLLVGGVSGEGISQLAANASAPYAAQAIGDYFTQPGHENQTAQLLTHAVLGGILAAANGTNAAAGASAGAAGELAAQVISKELYPQAYDANGNFHPEKLDTNQLNTVIGLSTAVGALVSGVAGGSAMDASVGANIAANAATNNFLKHDQATAMQKEFDQCSKKKGGCTDAEYVSIRNKYLSLSNQNIAQVQGCITNGDVACVKNLESQAAAGTEISNQLISTDQTIFINRQNNVLQNGSVKGAYSLFGTDVQQAQQIAEFKQANCVNLSASDCSGLVNQALNDRMTRGGVLGLVSAGASLMGSGLAKLKLPSARSTEVPISEVAAEVNTSAGAAKTATGANSAVDIGTADAAALQRAYLNNKFGRTGDLNLDINMRGNQEAATNFFRSQGVPEGNIPSYLTGIDFTQPVSVQTLGSGKPLWQYQTPGAPQGNWYSFSPSVQPTELGISPLGFNRATQAVEPKILTPYLTTEPVDMLRSTSVEELKLTDAMDRHFKLLFSVAETIVFQN